MLRYVEHWDRSPGSTHMSRWLTCQVTPSLVTRECYERWKCDRWPLRTVLDMHQPHWDRDGIRDSVRTEFAKVLACGTPALGAEVFASDRERRSSTTRASRV